jgi:hypothetical protein
MTMTKRLNCTVGAISRRCSTIGICIYDMWCVDPTHVVRQIH